MTRYRLIFALFVYAATPWQGAAAAGHSEISTDQVAGAISRAGMSVLSEQVTLLSDVVAHTASPNLIVESIEPWGEGRMKARLGCANSEECLPFYVSIRCNQAGGERPGGALLDQSYAPVSRPAPNPRSYVVRSGSRATLLLDRNHVHIRLSVICLENGAAGQRIRVESKDPKQTYVAEVVEGGVVRGSL
jgi:hypothetical protein